VITISNLLKPYGCHFFSTAKKSDQKMPRLRKKAKNHGFFSKNRELAKLRQHGFLNEKKPDFLNVFFLGGGNPFQIAIATNSVYHISYSHKTNGIKKYWAT
jgi:hypothetical protein